MVTVPSPYATWCPTCQEPSVSRTRGIPTYDWCGNGHKYLSADGIKRGTNPVRPEYVEGLLFSPCHSIVVLVRKADDCKIPVLRGKWVGVGGAIEPGESPGRAMARECFEETGLLVPISDWTPTVVLDLPEARVRFFSAVSDRWNEVRTAESKGETIAYFPVDRLPGLGPNMDVPLAIARHGARHGAGLDLPVALRRAA